MARKLPEGRCFPTLSRSGPGSDMAGRSITTRMGARPWLVEMPIQFAWPTQKSDTKVRTCWLKLKEARVGNMANSGQLSLGVTCSSKVIIPVGVKSIPDLLKITPKWWVQGKQTVCPGTPRARVSRALGCQMEAARRSKQKPCGPLVQS